MSFVQIYGIQIPDSRVFTYFYEHDPEFRAEFITTLGTEVPFHELQATLDEMTDPDGYVIFDREAIAEQIKASLPKLDKRTLPKSYLQCYRVLSNPGYVIGTALQQFHPHLPFTEVDETLEYSLAMIEHSLSATTYEIHKIPQFDSYVPAIYYRQGNLSGLGPKPTLSGR